MSTSCPAGAVRILKLLAVVFLVTLGTYAFLEALPGSPVDTMLPPGATPEQREALIKSENLDAPFVLRYVDWLGNAAQGNLGRETLTGRPVAQSLRDRLPVSLEIAIGVMAISLLISIPIGVYCGYRPGRRFDNAVTAVTSGVLSVPPFLMSVFLLYLFGIYLQWLPLSGWKPWSDGVGAHLQRMVLPIGVLAMDQAVVFIRLLRNDMMQTLQEDWALAARARGLPTRRVLVAHALRPSMFSLVTVMAVALGRLLGGTVIIEAVFGLPGIGSYLIQGVRTQDFVAVQGVVLFVAVVYVLTSTAVEAVYPLLDPRVRSGRP
jgi:peptide/nickel transport system permease protein